MPELGVMVIAIWSGEGTPTVLNDFLDRFATELNEILSNGIMINGCKLDIAFRCFICDTPARSFIKGLRNVFCAYRISCQFEYVVIHFSYCVFQSSIRMPEMHDSGAIFEEANELLQNSSHDQ